MVIIVGDHQKSKEMKSSGKGVSSDAVSRTKSKV